MLCSYLRQQCRSITIGQLIDILQLCNNKDAVVQLSEMTSFYIHFDQDGKFIDFSKSPLGNQYGNAKENLCLSCASFDKDNNICKFNSRTCINPESIIDTEKYDKLRSTEIPVQEPTKTEPSRTVTQNTKYDISNLSINGITTGATPVHEEEPKVTETVQPVIKQDKESTPTKDIQSIVDKAIINTLTRMIGGITGDK